MTRLRPLTPTERLYRILEPELPPFAIQLRIALPELPQNGALTQALSKTVRANPMLGAQCRGRWWHDEGRMPRIVEIDGGTAFSLRHAALLRRFDPSDGPPVELLRWPGAGLVLRAGHVAMDAAGMLHFAQDLFRALRGEPLLGSAAELNDWAVLKASKHCRPLPALQPTWRSPAGAPSPASGYLHTMRRVSGRVDSPTARIAAALARASQGGACRLMIPVDLRLSDRELLTTANLSNPLILDFDAAWDAAACWRHVLRALSRNEQFAHSRASFAVLWLPERPTGKVLAAVDRWQLRHGRHFFSALSSNLARVSLASFTFGGWTPDHVGFLPFDTPGAGLNLLTLQHDEALELAVSCPAATGDGGRLDGLLDAVCAELERGVAQGAARTAKARPSPRIAIASTFVAEPLAGLLASWMGLFGLPLKPSFAPYGQLHQALEDPGSVLRTNQDGVNVVLLRLEDWWRWGSSDDVSRANVDELLPAIERMAAHGDAPLIAWLAPLSERARNMPALAALQRTVEARLAAIDGLRLLPDAQVRRWYPVDHEAAPVSDVIGHVPFSRDRYAALASAISRTVIDATTPPIKVIVVDCDNTLWRGECGEQGPHGVEVTDAHRALQAWLVRQVEAGRLLCLASRNEAADVEAVFAQNPGMLLRPDHVVARRVDWHCKSDNIRAMVAELRLGLDSVVFIDDNPVECAEVEAHCAGVQVLRLPHESQIAVWLDHIWALPTVARATDRTRFYREQAERDEFRSQSSDFQAFLDSLRLQISVRPPAPDQGERIAELSRRTNQFNLMPTVRTAAHFRNLGPQCLAVHVMDRLGDYGLTGAVTWRVEGRSLHVDCWMLSCRVLGRGVEHKVLAALGELAAQVNCDDVILAFEPSSRNTPALKFLQVNCEAIETPTGTAFRISAQEARQIRVRAAEGLALQADASNPAPAQASRGLPAGVLDLIARERYDVARIREAAGQVSAAALDGDIHAGLLELARSASDGILHAAALDDSLFELGLDSLQIVTLLDEAASVYCPGQSAAGFNAVLSSFLEKPTLRELALALRRIQTVEAT